MVILQKPSLRHEEVFLRAVRKSRGLHEGLVSPPAGSEEFQEYLRSLRKRNRIGFLIMRPECDEPVGVVNVNEIVRGVFQSAYLGYYAFLPHAGRGLMREGMQEVIGYCFGELGLHRLEANIQPGNERSIGLVKGLGFLKEGDSPGYLKIDGEWRDHERWAIRAEQW
ncbi:MAG: GNAT family N-acetyltransferase [Verrucomicrobiaceae bacterium]